jgi:hypothetical protein
VRRGLGRGRTLIAIGCVLAIVSLPLAWRAAGGIVLPVRSEWGLAGPGLLLFLAAVLMLLLMVLPYASRSRQFALDRPISYGVLALVATVGMVTAVVDLVGGEEAYRLFPLDVPGLWLAAVATAIILWGVLELIAEPAPPP